jgi:DNA polymerase
VSEARVDFETRSDVDLKKHGSARYFASPHWRALIMCYSIDGGPVKEWTYRDVYCPADLAEHIRNGGYIRGHSVSFEMQALDQLARRQNWPPPRGRMASPWLAPAIDRYRCTAVEAAAMALPRSLEGVGAALNLPIQKDKEGDRLIKFFSIPQRRLKRHADLPPGPIWNEPEDHPEEFAKFVAYCRRDVEAEAEVAKRLVPLSAAEQEMYVLDQVINSRGLRVDLQSVHAAIAMAEKARATLEDELLTITGGYVTGINKGAEICRWLETQGVSTAGVAKDVVAELLELEDLPPKARRVLEIRQQGAKSSTAKLQAFIDRASTDGRVRHAFVMNAASTGRWSSRGVQLHNTPRPRKVFSDAHEDGHLNFASLFEIIRTADPAVVSFMYGPQLGQPLPLLSDALKGFIWAAPGHDLLAADYSGIEDAVGMWDAGETWALDAMREIIADPSKPDMYRLTAEGIYGEPIGKKDGRRQVGKVARLALGYEGGVSALWSMGRVYNLKLASVYEAVWAAADEERRERACKRYERCLKRKEAKADILSREGWIAGELVKIGYRESHPAVRDGWEIRRDAIHDAVAEPGKQVSALHCTYLVAHGFLWCRLPSGRCLAYAWPRLKPMVWFHDKATDEAECIPAEQGYARERDGEGKVKGPARSAVTALGVNSVTLAFERYALYGGLACENVVQAIAADLLRVGIKAAERAGYPVIGHVHDEILTEVPRGFGDVGDFERLITELPSWAAGLPLTASGWRGKRFRK